MALRLFRASAKRAHEEKASAAGPLMAFHGTGRAVWSPRDAVSLTRNGYEHNVIAFRALRMVAEAAAALPVRMRENGAVMVEHPVLALLDRPNPGQDGRTFLECLYGYLQLAGNAYVEAAMPDQIGMPGELYILRPDRMAVVPGNDGWPAAYDYSVGGRAKHRFDNSGEWKPILHLKAFHPLDDHYGMSPLEPAAASIDVHNAANRWSKALLDNAARPSGAIVFGAKDGSHMSEEQYQRLLRELEDNHQGARNAGRPLLLEGGLDWRPMGYSPSDMDFLETKNAAARDIALAFGVPPMLLGLPGDNTYSNYQEANRAFLRQTVLPLVTKALGAVAGWISRNSGEAISLEVDLENVPALSAERDALWRRVSQASFLDDNEKRALLGLAPRNGD